jgi:hypothetical protein
VGLRRDSGQPQSGQSLTGFGGPLQMTLGMRLGFGMWLSIVDFKGFITVNPINLTLYTPPCNGGVVRGPLRQDWVRNGGRLRGESAGHRGQSALVRRARRFACWSYDVRKTRRVFSHQDFDGPLDGCAPTRYRRVGRWPTGDCHSPATQLPRQFAHSQLPLLPPPRRGGRR